MPEPIFDPTQTPSNHDQNPASRNEPPDYRIFDIHGSHAHIGYEMGKADPPFRMQFWWYPPPPPDFADACRDVVHDIHPPLVDEFAAYTDAQHLNARELWQRCCRVNLKARVKPEDAIAAATPINTVRGTTEGCSTFVQFVDGATVVGRNYDYLPQQARRQRIRFVPDCCANASIGARGGVPCGRYDGLNQHGLFVSLHVVMTNTPSADEVAPGVPFHLVGRMALELCHSAREAVDLLTRMPHLSSLNYLVADARDAFVVEADPRRVRIIERSGNVLAATNHYRHPDMKPLQGSRAFANSECRLAFLQTTGDAVQGRWGDSAASSIGHLLDSAQNVMADRTAPVCGTSGSLTTLWSCVAELTTKRIRYAAGAPGFAPFVEMPQL